MTATNYLTQTFRSNQGITDVASRFVQKNPSQMKKCVSARDKMTQAVVVIRRYDKFEDIDEECEKCLSEIGSKRAAEDKRTTVFILGRYRFRKPDSLGTWKARFGASVDITFKTIHSSKGLEADYVIVLGMHTGRYAFPSEINDDPLLQLVMPHAESFPNAEERRLFYVALTRARHGVYLLGISYSPSGFLTELVEDESPRVGNTVPLYPTTCPRCQQGRLRIKTGRFGEFLGCSTFPTCGYTRDVADAA
jgi:DNA helicase IV